MTTQSICFAGLSREEEADVTARFKLANAHTGNRWSLANETEADVVVVDMDSMYGQMSLMKALSNGKVLVALTAGARADTDYLLARPVTTEGLEALLRQIQLPDRSAAAPVAEPQPAPAAPAPAPVAAAPVPAAAPPTPAPMPEPEPTPAPAPPAEPRLADYLRPGALAGPVKLQLDGAPALVLDPSNQTYLGAAALKPLIPYCTAVLRESDLHAVSRDEVPGLTTQLGGSQPFSRLAWLYALTGNPGTLASGYGLNDRYKLLKWPQTEREFPRHFRIATVMMKGPALLTDIAEQSGASLAEVIDFVNACLAVGVAEPDAPVVPEPDAAKGGLLGRFRR